MQELKPNTGTSMEEIINEKRKSRLPDKMRLLIEELLTEFEFDDKRKADVSRHILEADVDTALDDCVPMKVFFGMCANKFEEKEDLTDESIKILVSKSTLVKGEKVTQQKASVVASEAYKMFALRKAKYKKLKHNCRVLEQAMEMRRDLAQTKSANYRGGIKGPYNNLQM